jgi:hypothetical protein
MSFWEKLVEGSFWEKLCRKVLLATELQRFFILENIIFLQVLKNLRIFFYVANGVSYKHEKSQR